MTSTEIATPCKTGNFATWKLSESQTDDKWRLGQFFDSCDYLSRPSFDPDDQWWQHFADPEDHWWRQFDDPDDLGWRHFDNPCCDSWTLCDYPEWCHWWPIWQHRQPGAITRVKYVPRLIVGAYQMTIRTTWWLHRQLMTLSDDVANLVRRPI